MEGVGLFYSPVMLEYMVEKGLLEKKYYDNWLRLVFAIGILNMDSITPQCSSVTMTYMGVSIPPLD